MIELVSNEATKLHSNCDAPKLPLGWFTDMGAWIYIAIMPEFMHVFV